MRPETQYLSERIYGRCYGEGHACITQELYDKVIANCREGDASGMMMQMEYAQANAVAPTPGLQKWQMVEVIRTALADYEDE